MAPLPYLGNTKDTEDWTSTQIWVFAFSTYFVSTCFFLGMVLALINITRFIMHERKKSKWGHPLMTFYIWIVLDFLSNLVWEIMVVKISYYSRPLLVFLPATFKVLLGIEQIWLMFELIIQINIATRLLTITDSVGGDEISNYAKEE